MAKAANNSLFNSALLIGLAGVIISAGMTSHNILTFKAAEQTAITESVARWKSSYRALAGTQEQWSRSYKPASQVRDQLSLVSLLALDSYGLKADTDSLVLQSVTEVESNNQALGLTRLCMGTGGESFIVESDNYDSLLRGVSMLAQRPDIVVEHISILGEKDVPQAKLGQLCIYLRSE